MASPGPKDGLSGNPLLALIIGACSVGLISFGAWRVAAGNRDWTMLTVDLVLGTGGVLYAIEVFRARGRTPPKA